MANLLAMPELKLTVARSAIVPVLTDGRSEIKLED